jgi:hypothetical protein
MKENLLRLIGVCVWAITMVVLLVAFLLVGLFGGR